MALPPEHRIANNQSVFRRVNESIERGRWPGEEDAPAVFCCECAQFGCGELIELSVREYERVRANGRRFIVALGHNLPEVEDVVEEHEGYLVVEKRGAAARRAEAADPRS